MVNSLYLKLIEHVGCKLECVTYGDDADNVSVECLDHGCVLVDADKEENEDDKG